MYRWSWVDVVVCVMAFCAVPIMIARGYVLPAVPMAFVCGALFTKVLNNWYWKRMRALYREFPQLAVKAVEEMLGDG